ncbi:serine/threonine protein kinase [Nakamurella sp. UYEF19]|uniref:serine/threonine-protein kinase n=1 Tax=Nakamurella sp. UYEF19 TaxID=1756392 RepID=UPI0033908D57
MSSEADPTKAYSGPSDVVPVSLVVSAGAVLDGRYRLEELLGRGGTAQVYRADDLVLRRSVAIKIFNSPANDLNNVVRQRNEMHVLAGLNHPNLIAVHDARVADGSVSGPDRAGHTASGSTYLVMELVVGDTLAERLMAGPLSAGEAAGLGATLASVLQLVHSKNLVHRDVKPANILLADNGEIKLGDFGLARVLDADSRLTTGADVMGTAAYFSPEQASAEEVGAPGDIYALGLVLLECLTGRREFPGDAVPAAVARLLRDPAVPASLPEPWPMLLTAMTRRDPATRPTAADVAKGLGALNSSPIPAPAATTASPGSAADTTRGSAPLGQFVWVADQRQRGAPRRYRRVMLSGAGVLLVAILGTAFLLARPDADGPSSTSVPVGVSTIHPVQTSAPRTQPSSAPRTQLADTSRAAPPVVAGSARPAPTTSRSGSAVVVTTRVVLAPVPPGRTPPATSPVTSPPVVPTPTATTPTAFSAPAQPGNGNGNGNGKRNGNGNGGKKPKK